MKTRYIYLAIVAVSLVSQQYFPVSPRYLGITLDRTLTYKQHCINTKMKVGARNNILRRLTQTSWGASPHVLRTSGLALSFSAGEYACPVWHRSAHAKEVDVALNETCRIITGCLKPTPLPMLYPLAGIAPPGVRRNVACAVEKQKQEKDQRHPLHNHELPPSRLSSRKSFLRSTEPISCTPAEAKKRLWTIKCPPPPAFIPPCAPFLVIIVTSYVGHVELRSAHRRAMPQEVLKILNTCRVFLLAKIPNNEKYISQKAIEDESIAFGDILQGSFTENYRNLTAKHLMGLNYASKTNARFVLKVDDDTVFSLENTYKLLKGHDNLDNTMLGYMLNNTKPRRSKQNKWYVTWEEYPRNDYPAYLSGWYYITTPEVAAKLSDEAIHHRQFWIDDILITGLLTESLNIKLKQLPENYWLEYYELLECCINDMIKSNIKCEYTVGPNGNRNNLMYEYNEALTNCDILKCKERPRDRPLKKTCIAFKDRTIFSDGLPKIESIKL